MIGLALQRTRIVTHNWLTAPRLLCIVLEDNGLSADKGNDYGVYLLFNAFLDYLLTFENGPVFLRSFV